MYSKEKPTIACVLSRRRNQMERPCFDDINERNLKGSKNWKNPLSYLYQLLTKRTVHEGPNHATATWKKDFFPFFVFCFFFVYFYIYFAIRISRFILFTFLVIRIFPSASTIRRYPVHVLQTPVSVRVPWYTTRKLCKAVITLIYQLNYIFVHLNSVETRDKT